MNGGLNLVGSPLSFNNLTRRILPASDGPSVSAESLPSPNDDNVLYVRNDGYFPQTINVPAGQSFTLDLVTDKTYSCSRDFVIPELNYYQLLPETGTVQVEIPAQTAGTRIFFTCSMGMYTGQIVFE